MGAKEIKEIPDRLKDNIAILKCILQELRLMRNDLKAWKVADTEHHLSDNGALFEAVKQMNRFFEAYFKEHGGDVEGSSGTESIRPTPP